MGDKRKFTLQGQEVWGEEVEFEPEHEGRNTYILQDGTKLKMRTVLNEVYRLDAYKPDGEPLYMVNSTNVVTAIVPERLKRKENPDGS
jgi:hypothetical protein